MEEMDEIIARLNIERFRELLAKERDEAKRQTILQLLADEEVKLRALKNKRLHGSAGE
jgi:hypothetical protein